MSPQTPPLDRRDLYKDRRYDRPPGNPSDASRYPYSSRDYSRRAPSGYYKSYPEESGSRGGTPSRSDRFYYEEHNFRGYNNHHRYERGRTSNRDRSFRRSPRYDPYHHHTDYLRRSPNYEPYHHHTDYLRRSPNYDPYHHDQYPPDHHHHHHHHQRMIRSMAVPYSSSSRLNPDDYHKRLSSERRPDWERERERERDRERERERDRERKREDGVMRWSRSGREREGDVSESVVKRNQDDYKGFEEDLPAKKARLGWGQGLAKYEKLKVGDPEPFKEFVININNNNNNNNNNNDDVDNNFNNNNNNILEKEVIVEKEKESVACEGEIGAENNATCLPLIGSEKDGMPCQDMVCSEKDAMTCQDPIGAENKVMMCQALICSKKDDVVMFQAPIEPVEVSIVVTSATENEETPCVATAGNKECEEAEDILPNLDILDGNSNFALSSFLTNLLQKEDFKIGDVILHRLGSLKEDISKQIEITETEIDLLETEIKLLEHDDDNNNINNVIKASPELIIINNESNTSAEEREINNDYSLNIITPVQKSSPEYDNNKTTLLNPEPNPNLIIPKILASNLDASNTANTIIPSGLIIPDPNMLEILVSAIKSQTEKQMRIKEMIRVHKKEIKFKEIVLAHKYRVFRHIWKEDLKLIPDKKSRSKSNCSYKNNISRTRLYSSSGNLTPVGTKKALQFTKKLMSSNSISRIFRPHLKMPSLILSQTEKKFISRNGLIFDPVTSEKGKTVINPWTQFEKETFIHMLCTFGKDFTKISSFLPHKTTADCVQFYYKNHKKKFFKDMKRLSVTNETKSLTGGNSNYLGFNEPKTLTGGNNNYLGFNEPKPLTGSNNNYLGFNEPKTLNGGKNNYLGFNEPKTLTGGNSTSAKKRKRENNSVQNIPPPKNNSKNNNINNNLNNSKKKSPTLVKLKSNASEPPKRVNYTKKTKSVDLSTPLPPPNPNPNSLSPDPTKKSNSSEGVSSCITNSIYNEKENNNFNIFLEEDEGFCSDDGWREVDSSHWTNDEKSLFIKGLALYNKDFNKISNCVGTRSSDQCKVFFSKSWKSLSLDAGFEINANPGIGNPGIGNPGNGNLGIGDCEKGSSSDEVCMAEEISDVKIFGRIIACKQGDGNNGNNDNNEGVLSEIKPSEIKDAIISVLGDENNQNKKDVSESLPVVESGRA